MNKKGIDPNHKPKNDYEFYLHFSKLACRAATKEESDFIADEAKQFEILKNRNKGGSKSRKHRRKRRKTKRKKKRRKKKTMRKKRKKGRKTRRK